MVVDAAIGRELAFQDFPLVTVEHHAAAGLVVAAPVATRYRAFAVPGFDALPVGVLDLRDAHGVAAGQSHGDVFPVIITSVDGHYAVSLMLRGSSVLPAYTYEANSLILRMIGTPMSTCSTATPLLTMSCPGGSVTT